MYKKKKKRQREIIFIIVGSIIVLILFVISLLMDNSKKVIKNKLLFLGTINYSMVHPREIFKEAYLVSACCIVCLHNHPSNDVTPSKEDIMFTERLIRTGNIQGIPVVDHIIVGNDSYYSFYENKNSLNI